MFVRHPTVRRSNGALLAKKDATMCRESVWPFRKLKFPTWWFATKVEFRYGGKGELVWGSTVIGLGSDGSCVSLLGVEGSLRGGVGVPMVV